MGREYGFYAALVLGATIFAAGTFFTVWNRPTGPTGGDPPPGNARRPLSPQQQQQSQQVRPTHI